jgi:hypothetical protein
VSWFRPQLEVSLELMSLAGLNEKSRVIEIGAGAPEDIQKLFGSHFALVASRTEQHITPARASQRFAYALLKKVKLRW